MYAGTLLEVVRPRWRLVIACAFAATLLLAVAGSGAVALASPADQSVAYQQGASHDGQIADAGLATPLAQQWSITLPGAISYPLIVNGMVFVTAADKKVYALNQATGATVWSRDLGGGSPTASLTYDRGRVFAINDDGDLTAFDPVTGSIAWSKRLPDQYFFSSPPTAVEGIVYVSGGGLGGTLYGVRERDGRVLWTQPVEGSASSPAVDASAVYVTYSCHADHAFDRVSGAPLWRNSPSCSGGGGRTPVVAGGRVFAREPFDTGRILSAASGAQLGSFAPGPAPAVAGGMMFGLSASTLKAVANSGLGAELWQFTGDGSLSTAPLVVGGTVFAGSSSGQLYALDAAAGTTSWSANVGSSIPAPDEHNVSQPLTGLGAANGTLVVPAGDRLVAYRTAGAITQAPVNQVPPTIDGKAQEGQLLGADVGIWSGLPSAYAYRWQRCDAAGAGCTDIGAATAAAFQATAADIGSTMRVRVTASNANGASAPLSSNASAVVSVSPPVSLIAPSVTGSARQAATLTVDPGTWSNTPTGYAFRWQRCTPDPMPACSDVAGATASTYVLDAADVGSRIRTRVIATNAGGDSEPADSPLTAPVLPLPPVNNRLPDFSGNLQERATLTADPGGWTGSPTNYAYQWYSCEPSGASCPDIAGATAATYVVAAGDVDRYIGIEVIATNAGGDSQPEPSGPFGPVLPLYPLNQTPPAISGTTQDGQTLTADPGTWSGSPAAYGYQWYRCDAPVQACDVLAAATSSTYRLGPADVGRRLGVGVVAGNRGGQSDEELSPLTDVVRPAAAVAPAPVTPPPAPPPPPPPPPPDNTFTTLSTRVRSDASIAVMLKATGPGTFTGTATAQSAALAKGCRGCKRSGRATYGRGSARAREAGSVLLVIKPTARARIALRHNRVIRVRLEVRFGSARGGTPTTRVRTLLVRRPRARAARRGLQVGAVRRAVAGPGAAFATPRFPARALPAPSSPGRRGTRRPSS